MMLIVTNAPASAWVTLAVLFVGVLSIGFGVGHVVGRQQGLREEKRWLWRTLQDCRKTDLFESLPQMYDFLEAVLEPTEK